MISTGYIGRMIDKYGSHLTVSAAGSPLNRRNFCAFIQPLRYKNKMYLFGSFTRAGYVDESYYLYVGPGDVNICSLDQSARLISDGQSFYFTRRECVMLSGQPVYYWAVLRALKTEE